MTDDSTYISKEGLEELKNELEKRKRETRREIANRIASAKELGDLSENFEYHEAKEQQAQNETRILQLENMIRSAVIVEKKSGGAIALGSTFTVETAGVERELQLVGATESDPTEGQISNESPIGEAFLGKTEGDEVDVEVPSGTVHYKILNIK